MKRCALLIGYSGEESESGFLSGVSKDLTNYKNYLMSANGGAWYSSEIITIENESSSYIKSVIQKIKTDSYDMVFSVFTGHGAFDINQLNRIIEINNSEDISEKILWNLAPRQILILDSCSNLSFDNIFLDEAKLSAGMQNFSLNKEFIRKQYQNSCLACPAQFIRLYASELMTSAKDSEKGGLYSYNLLKFLTQQNTYIDIVKAHDIISNFLANEEQFPEKRVPRVARFLPGSLGIGK